MRKELAPRGRFELPTFRLTAERPTSSEFAGVGTNRRNSASCDETGRIMFSFFIHLSFGFCRHSPPLALRFYDSAYRYRLGSILYDCSRSNTDLRLMGSSNDAITRRLHRTVRRPSQLEVAPSTEKVIVYHPRRSHGADPLRESWHAC